MRKFKYKYRCEIIALVISIILLLIGLFVKNNVKPIYVILGEIFFFMGIFLSIEKDENRRGFEIVCDNCRKFPKHSIILPQRSSKKSAAYDFFACDNYTVQPNEVVKVWTDVKAYMQDDEFLMLDVRSSMGGKFMLANTIGIIDSDYYSNENNDGNIGIFLKNISNEVQTIERGSRIAQGIFTKYLITETDNATNTRKGGWVQQDDEQNIRRND